MKRYVHADALADRIGGAVSKATPLVVTAYRAVQIEYANERDLLSGEGTKNAGGRWTPPGSFATVHASLEVETAVAESLGTQQRYGIPVAARLPLVLVAIDCRLQAILDLTDEAILECLELSRRRLARCRWRESMDKEREALTQAVGRAAFEQKLEGLLVPSAQKRQGRNLVVFPAQLRPGSSLRIQNVAKLPRSERLMPPPM